MRIPSDLAVAGRKFWKEVTARFLFEEAHDLQRLRLACLCLDQVDALKAAIDADGAMVKGLGDTMKENPAGKALRETITCFNRTIRELGLDLENRIDTPRPPALYK